MATSGRISTIGGVAFFVIALSLTDPVAQAATQQERCWNNATPAKERLEACSAFIGSSEATAWAFRARGDAYLATGEMDRAAEDYEEAFRRKPDDLTSHINRGNMLAEKGDYDHAIRLFESAIRLASGDAKIAGMLDALLGSFVFRISEDGRSLEFSGFIDVRAAREFERLLAAEPAIRLVGLRSRGGIRHAARRMAGTIRRLNLDTAAFDECLSACADIFLAGRERIIGPRGVIGFHLGRSAGTKEGEERRDGVAIETARLRKAGLSESFARRAIRAEANDIWRPSRAELLKERVVTRFAKTSETPSPADRRIAREPKAIEFLLLSSYRFYFDKKYDHAARHLDEILRGDTHQPDALLHRANMFATKGDVVRALVDYDALIQLDPGSAQAFFQRGEARWKANDLDNALKDLDEALRLDPDIVDAYISRGRIHHHRKAYSQAMENFDTALRLVPDHSEGLSWRAATHLDLGDHVRAQNDASRSLLLKQNPFAFRVRGVANYRKGDLGRAIEDLDHAIRMNPADPLAWNSRCWSHSMVGRLEEALSDCNEALRLRPGETNTLLGRGVVWMKQGMFDNALADFEAILQRVPNQPSALYGRGLAKLKNGNIDGGNADLATARAKRPSVPSEFSKIGISEH